MTATIRPCPDQHPSLPPHLELILGLSPSVMTLGLGNVLALLARLGNPESKMRTAVIAGTNGKGSVTAMLASLLRRQGMRVGRFTSPHVYDVTERVWVDGHTVELEEMERAAARVAPLRDEMEFSYFEALTAMAFLIFVDRGVEIAVLETGLGGRFDATNVTSPDVTVITSISLDHRRVLGDTTEEILREKLGISRPGVPLLFGDLGEPLLRQIEERAARDGFESGPLARLGSVSSVGDGSRDERVVSITTARALYDNVELPFPGRHQRHNALLAVAAAERITNGPLIDVERAMKETYMPGRFERFEYGNKTLFLDVAHNQAALAASLRQLEAISPRVENAVVFGMKKRKELFDIPGELMRCASRIYLVTAPGSDDSAYMPHELISNFFHDAPGSRTDVIMCPADAGDWRRLVDSLLHPDNPCRTILALGSHNVVEHIGGALHMEVAGR